MKSYLLVLLLAGAAVVQSQKVQKRVQNLVHNLNTAQTKVTHSCSYAISRVKNNVPADYASIIGSGSSYTDADFPTSDALYWSDYTTSTLSYLDSFIQWDRVRNRVPTATLYGSSGVLPYDISQGAVGDCYYMASCAATAENAVRLSNSFMQSTYSAEGIFAIKAYVLGIQTTFTIDDYLAFNSASSTLLFTKIPSTGALWGPLLEKLWAKITGNYELTTSGWPTEAVRFLTGAPSYTYYVADYTSSVADTFWSLIQDGETRNLIMTASTWSSTGGDIVTNAVGLAMSHAYTVLSAYTLLNADGSTKAKLLKMRNPWGVDGDYNGTWSDYDSTWNTAGQTYISQVGWSNDTSDGVFYITVDDFIIYFQALVVSHYHDNWVHSTSKVTGDGGTWKRFDFTLATAQEGFIGIDFYTNRMYPTGCKASSTSGSLRVYMGGKLIDATVAYDVDYYSFIYSSSFAAGTYSVYFKPTWVTNDVPDYTMRTYFADTVTITRTDYTTDALAWAAMIVNGQTTTSLSTYFASAIADTTTAFSTKTYTYFTATYGWWGSTDYSLYYYKMKQTSTAMGCTYTIKFKSASSGITNDQGTCTTTYDSTYNYNIHTCSCTLSTLSAVTGVTACNYMVQVSGLSSVSLSTSISYSCSSKI